MSVVQKIHAREVFDSRGRPTVEVEVTCQGGHTGRAIVPSGASTGRFEAVELRDGDTNRLDGAGVLKAVEHVRTVIADALVGCNCVDQEQIDQRLCELDGTDNKSKLGANALLGVSLAAAHAAARATESTLVEHFRRIWQSVPGTPTSESTGKPNTESSDKFVIPLPMVNMVSGGLHAGGNLDFQDVLILPVGSKSFRQAMDWVVAVYHRLGDILRRDGYEGWLVGDEGGYGPRLKTNHEAVEVVVRAIEEAGLVPGDDVAIGLDVASTHFYDDGCYRLSTGETRTLSSDEFIELLEGWVDRYPIISIEDPLAEDDWDGWKTLTERIGRRVQIIGDDLFVTNVSRLQRGIQMGVANSVLIKPNQIGTLWETLQTMRLAVDAGYAPVVSARSGETEDTTIADLVVATGAGQIKIGSVARSERLAKYNQLLRLEEQLKDRSTYAGSTVFPMM